MDITSLEFDEVREWIRVEHDISHASWDDLFNKPKQYTVEEFLAYQINMNHWPNMSKTDWQNLVESERVANEEFLNILDTSQQALIAEANENNALQIPTNPKSSWVLYRKKLLSKGYKEKTLKIMQYTTERILKRLDGDTSTKDPVKGLVIGNVQSGKTGNMGALMSMAADNGFNFFIILSGTIENLRKQTETRLYKDLSNDDCNIHWNYKSHLKKKAKPGDMAQDCDFAKGSKERYFTVCLKNSTRLRDLIQWLQLDSNKQSQMKILLIDDESDQAGINTADITQEERNKINKLISALVHGNDENNKPIKSKYLAMNYIGYTATPYANMLNEPPSKPGSLYPASFISTLPVSQEYFGPQQIFGLEGDDKYQGLNIIHEIETDELDWIQDIHDGQKYALPDSLKDAVAWFICCVATQRLWNYKKPVSMLVHTSQKTDHHKRIADVIKDWLIEGDPEKIISRCKNVWLKETENFSFETFRKQYPDYDRTDDEINKYPEFKEIEIEIKDIIAKYKTSYILLDDEGEPQYSKGIHLCIDNCKSNSTEDGYHLRLIYPKEDLDFASAFSVVGGTTLSRGLTIEGLVSTYFLRTVGQADTLMQMGRWFGYRKGYELLPRLWITERTRQQFNFLSVLDQELREEIEKMEVYNKSPSEYGARVKNTPNYKFIRITAKNRMQSAEENSWDFSGKLNQTFLFENTKDLLDDNIKYTEEFIQELETPEPWVKGNEHAQNAFVWRNVEFEKIETYWNKFHFNSRSPFFSNINVPIEWIKKNTENGNIKNWNVAVCGIARNDTNPWKFEYGTINRVRRSKKHRTSGENTINIGVLRDPRDMYVDIDFSKLTEEKINIIKSSKAKLIGKARDDVGYDKIPLLLIYRIDKDSPKTSDSTEDLHAESDIIGLTVYLPGESKGNNCATTISIPLKHLDDDELDLE